MNDELIRHYLIEPSTRGVKIKGCLEEPSFGSLSALIYQHSITNIALPCKLIIPTSSNFTFLLHVFFVEKCVCFLFVLV